MLYGLRFLFAILTMEIILHYTYVVAISKTRAWEGSSPFQLSMISYFNLQIIWLKVHPPSSTGRADPQLLLPWRFFRLWAMADGIETPENMLRCMSNNYSALAFWRAWHRSFNRWVIRYIYIPLGGNKHQIVNMLAVFTFVAFWHDISLKLLAWGWLVTLFILPEVLARMAMPPKKVRHQDLIGC
jgi:D-alanyl-lipoteichoic acid acyltransferase DltB (MBOAT superfamily)